MVFKLRNGLEIYSKWFWYIEYIKIIFCILLNILYFLIYIFLYKMVGIWLWIVGNFLKVFFFFN